MMSMTPVRDSTNARPSKQMKSAVTVAKKRSRRRRSATRYISPTNRLPNSVVPSRHVQLLNPKTAIGGAINNFASGGSGSKYDSAGCRRSHRNERAFSARSAGGRESDPERGDRTAAAEEVGKNGAREAQAKCQNDQGDDGNDIESTQLQEPTQPGAHERRTAVRDGSYRVCFRYFG